jgi:hypothetical protein
MAHFAELDNNNIVLRTIVIDNKNTSDDKGVEKEEIGIAFCKSLFGENTKWVQTSYNNNLRGHFAGIDDVYDPIKDEFIPGNRGPISHDNEEIIDVEVVNKALE